MSKAVILNKTFKLSDYNLQQIDLFANHIDTTYYANRDAQVNNTKRIEDAKVGKAGEVGAHLYLLTNAIHKSDPFSAPDFQIYPPNQKSWSWDIFNRQLNIAVKSQNIKQSQRFKPSWIFEKTDKEINQSKENDYVIFTIVDLDNKEVHIKAIVSIQYLKDNNLFKEPMKESLRNTKYAVYYEDLI